MQRSRTSKTTLIKNKVEGLILPYIKQYYKTIVINRVWYQNKDR